MKRLFQLTDKHTGKSTGIYYENKQHAKAARSPSTKVSPGPDHRRYNHDRR